MSRVIACVDKGIACRAQPLVVLAHPPVLFLPREENLIGYPGGVDGAQANVGGLPAYQVREGQHEDLPFLREMLYEAVCWRPDAARPPLDEVLSDPAIAKYVEGWSRKGDAAVIATDSEGFRRIGAAWYRLMPEEDPGYGFVDARTPELAAGVSPDRRASSSARPTTTRWPFSLATARPASSWPATPRRGRVHGRRPLYGTINRHQRSETKHSLSQGSAPC
jgi:hypothetical protein